jgi:hypothetical protein
MAATTTLPDNEPTSETVVNAVAAQLGVSPIDVRLRLYAAVDPDELDDLTSRLSNWSDDSPGRIVFADAGYEVTVHGDGEVSLAADASGAEYPRRPRPPRLPESR